MSITRWSGSLVAALILASSAAAAAQIPAPATPPEGVSWVLRELLVGGELADVPDGVDPTLLLAGGDAGGSGGCNSWSGPYTLDGEALAFGPLMSTAMLCPEPAMSTETSYLADLAMVASFGMRRDALTLKDRNGDDVLVFEEAETPTIAGGWIVVSYVNGGRDLVAPMAGSLLTVVFGADGAIEGSSGCNHFSAAYTVDGDGLTVGPMASTAMACASPELQTQEQQFLAALAASNRWSRTGTDLELLNASGIGKDTTMRLTADHEASYIGSWTVTGYDIGNGTIEAPKAGSDLTAVLAIDGTIEGSAGCNDYSGPFTVAGWAMTIGPVATTRMTCGADVDTPEQRYLDALQTVTSWADEGEGIVLRGPDGATKVTLAPGR